MLFNRFLQPDIDPETLTVVHRGVVLQPGGDSIAADLDCVTARTGAARRSPRRTGVESPSNVIKYLLAGADVVMTASALLRHGPEHADRTTRRVVRMDAAQGIYHRRGTAWACSPYPSAPTRPLTANARDYVSALRQANNTDYGPW